MPPHHSKQLNIILWNCNSLEPRIDELHAFAHDRVYEPDMMLLTETRLHPDWIGTGWRWLEQKLKVAKYRNYLYAHHSGYGGISAYVRDSVSHRKAPAKWQPIHRPAHSKCYLQWFEVRVPLLPEAIMIGVCYIPPEGSSRYKFERDRDWFAANVNYVASRRHCVLSGDFNARHEEFGEIEGAAANNARGAWLRDLMLPLQMECLNYTWLDGDYTHIASNAQHSNSMIDLVFTNAPGIIYDIEVMRDTVLVSDHLPLRIVVKHLMPSCLSRSVHVRCMTYTVQLMSSGSSMITI